MVKKILIVSLLFGLIISACSTNPKNEGEDITQVSPFSTDHLVISEISAGIDGNNLYDFIELYNPTGEIIDLKGDSLWYQLKDDSEPTRILLWNQQTLVPPFGHYFIGYDGQDFGIQTDMVFDQPLVGGRGGLALKHGEDTIDQVAWGDGPQAFAEGSPAAAMDLGNSLERLPGGAQGNGLDDGDNRTDFATSAQPAPQNTGSTAEPTLNQALSLELSIPAQTLPGSEFSYAFTLKNLTDSPVEGIQIFIPVSNQLTLVGSTPEAQVSDGTAVISIDSLDAQGEVSGELDFQAPWTFDEIMVPNVYAASAMLPYPAFAGPQHFSIGGGAIPISTARSLIDQEVVVKGSATMYPDGLYAGSGAKFYIQDETGGVQVYVPQAANAYDMPLGSQVQVEGRIQLYRGTVELVPSSIGAVEVMDEDLVSMPPTPVSVLDAATDITNLPGLLVQVEGLVTRVEQVSYGYEIDIMDARGDLVTCYVDELTDFSLDSINLGDRYKVTGIAESLDDYQMIYPRLLSDFEKVYPPELMVEVHAPTSVEQGQEFEIRFDVVNHTADMLTNTTVKYTLPAELEVASIGNDGAQDGEEVTWTIPELDGDGASASVSLQVTAPSSAEYVTIQDFQATADQWETPVSGSPTYTFFGDTVPIWAIQGPGNKTPYRLEKLETQGVVTGVFPDLEGFWIQETTTDTDPLTSSGLFVDTGTLVFDVHAGDLVNVTGYTGEAFQQTQIEVKSATGVEVVSSGNPLPAPVQLDPPADLTDALNYFETLEGMLVDLPGPAIAVGPTNQYGEFAVVLAKHLVNRIFHNGQTGLVIRADDGMSSVLNTQDELQTVVAVGDQVSNLVGPLAYTYGDFKVEPIQPVDVVSSGKQPQPHAMLAADQFSLMTWNVENMFDFTPPHPSSPPMPSVREYKLALEKIANTIVYAGAPTLVGLQEVENIGILEDIAAQDVLAEYGYVPFLIEGTDSRFIDVGYLLRGDVAEMIDVQQFPAPENLTSRPPLLIRFSLPDGTEIDVINNHFTSMSGGEASTEPRRTAQAAWNVQLVQNILAENPNAYVAVMGDLNSFSGSLPIETLQAAGLQDVIDQLPPEGRYTYVYQGVSQVLDHILISDALFELIDQVFVLHADADYPLPPADDPSPYHRSDHDPVIVIFSIP